MIVKRAVRVTFIMAIACVTAFVIVMNKSGVAFSSERPRPGKFVAAAPRGDAGSAQSKRKFQKIGTAERALRPQQVPTGRAVSGATSAPEAEPGLTLARPNGADRLKKRLGGG